MDWELDETGLVEQVRAVDLLMDCTDNFASRSLLNRVAMAESAPLVSGAAIRM